MLLELSLIFKFSLNKYNQLKFAVFDIENCVTGLLRLRKVMLIQYTKKIWLNLTELHILIYLGGQGGLVHLNAFWKHISLMIGNLFLLMKMKQINQSLVGQQCMAW